MQKISDKDGLIWFDGKWVNWRDAKIHVLTHSLHYGMGVFEGLRAYAVNNGSTIFRLQEHTDRLFNSAKITRMNIPFDKKTINKAQKDAVIKNNLQSAYIRPICFYGSEGMGIRADNLKVHVAIAAWDWGSYLGKDNMKNGIRIKTSSYTRHHPNITMTKAKITGNYTNSILALQEAITDGYDEALLLDTDGFIAEGSGENIFIINKNIIYTPDLSSALAGITRDTIIILLNDLGYKVIEKRISRDEVYCANEAFFTGTAAEVTPIRELDNRIIGNGSCGPITKKIQQLYFSCVSGNEDKYKHWIKDGIIDE